MRPIFCSTLWYLADTQNSIEKTEYVQDNVLSAGHYGKIPTQRHEAIQRRPTAAFLITVEGYRLMCF